MKVVLFICLALSSSVYAADEALTQDLMEFVDLLPAGKLTEVITNYVQDPKFVEILDYLLVSQEFKDLLVGLERIPEYVNYLKYLDDSGLDVYDYLRALYEAIGLPPPSLPMTKIRSEHTRGIMNDLINELRALLPKDAIKALHKEKIMTSTAFRFFVERMTSEEGVAMKIKLIQNPKFAAAMNTLKQRGVEVVDYAEFVSEMFGLI